MLRELWVNARHHIFTATKCAHEQAMNSLSKIDLNVAIFVARNLILSLSLSFQFNKVVCFVRVFIAECFVQD